MACVKFVGVGALAFCASLLGAAELQTAGEMLIDLDAANLELAVGANVEAWPNAGSEPDFAHCNTHAKDTRPTYQVRNGAPAVRFAGSSSGSLTNGVPTPAALTGNQAWSVEGWVAPTKAQGDARCWLSLTTHNGLENNALSKACFQLDTTVTAAVDHWDRTLLWGRRDPENALYRPTVGAWSYICVVHEATGYERLYVNGHLASEANGDLALNDTEPSFVSISGIMKRDTLGWEKQVYADIGQVRVQTGALTAAQVFNNFSAEKARYGVTDTPDALWTDGGTWFGDRPFVSGDNLVIEGDQPLVINNGASNEVHFVTVNAAKNTGLTVDNGSQLVVSYGNNPADFGNNAGGTFTLAIPNGQLDTPANSLAIGTYTKGVAIVGGDETATGVMNVGSSLRVGNYANGQGELVVKTNGIVNVANTFRISDNAATGNQVTVEAGGTLAVVGDAYISSGTGEGRLDVYGYFACGTTNNAPNCYLASANETSKGTIWAHPGAYLDIQTCRIVSDNTAADGRLVLERATLHETNGRTWWLSTQCKLEVKDAATLDVDAGLTANIGGPVTDLTEEGNATIEKVGAGTVVFTNDGTNPPISDPFTFVVKEGRLTIKTATTLAVGNTATFKLDGGEVSADYEGGAAALLARLDKTSKGRFVIHGNNSAESLDFSEYPDVEIVPDGGITITGTITPYENKYVFRPIKGVTIYSGNIADKNGQPASVEIYGATATDGVTLSGINDSMSGNISVYSGILGISGGSEAAGGATTKLYLAEGTALKLDFRAGKTFLKTRVDPASRPATILLTANSAEVDVDLTQFPGCRVGTDVQGTTPVVHAGTLTPTADNEYLLGGGALPYWQTSHRGFQPSVLLDTAAGSAKVQVATTGLVNLSNTSNAYSGGTEIVAGGAAFISADGFGAVPEEFDEANIVLNTGVIRSGPDGTTISLAATRGVKIGEEGAELHPWGTSVLEILGGLTGTGALGITDGGKVALPGAHNTYNGHITGGNTATTLAIGGDEAFSWASTGGIELAGSVVVKNVADATFDDVISGTASFTKEGAGTLTLTKPQTYSGATVLSAGKLVLADGATLANTSSFRNDGEVTFTSLAALGTGSLSGDGLFKVAGDVALDAGRLTGNPNFEVLAGGSLGVEAPSFGMNTQVTFDEGSAASLGSGVAGKIDGFGAFNLNGTAKLVDDELRLTENAARQVASAFYSRRVRVSESWEATYSFQAGEHDDWVTDYAGVGLVFQNEAAGPAALGTYGDTIGCGFVKSVGAILRIGSEQDTYNRYGFSNAGVIADATSARSNAIAAQNMNEVQVKITYDGTTLRSTWVCNGNTRTKDWTVNLAEVIGTDFAWIGFCGATGAETGCALTVRNFTFRGGAYQTIPGIGETGWTPSKYAPTLTTVDDKPAFQLTTNASDSRSSTWNATRINVNRPFRASFKYRVGEHSAQPADGFAIAVQNYSTAAGDCYGATGGSMGIIYGTPRARTVGWGVNLYKGVDDQCFKFVLAGSFNGDTVPLKEWDLANGEDTEFLLAYDGANLSLTATRNGYSVTATRAVDLASAMEGNEAWIGFCGATGGSTAQQIVYDFVFAYEEIDLTSRYANPFVVAGATALTLGQGAVGFADLTLRDGAAITATTETDGASLELGGTTVEGAATVACVETAPIVLQDTITFTSGTGTLKLKGDVRTNGKVKLELAKFKGVRKVLDLTEAKGDLTIDDFEVVGEQAPLKMDINGGFLRVWLDVSTAIFFR